MVARIFSKRLLTSAAGYAPQFPKMPGGTRTIDKKYQNVASILAAGATCLLLPAFAHAHFRLDAPACWLSQDTFGGPQKNGPCAAIPNTGLGDVAGTATGMVTALPGQTISVTVTATIPHPGWWRIALMEGASSTQTLTSIPDPRAQAGTNCTPAIMNNPVWSTTQPVVADGLPVGSTAQTLQSGTQTFSITVPQNATCTAARPCTVQVIMVMTDHPANDCYYHHCADVSMGNAPPGTGGNGAGGMAGRAGGGGTAGRAGAGSGGAGGGRGGSAGTGGSLAGSGGATTGSGGSGGMTGTGGATAGTGGAFGTGGATGTGGGTAGSGGATAGGLDAGKDTAAAASSSGCACSLSLAQGHVPGAPLVLLLGSAVAFLRRRRR